MSKKITAVIPAYNEEDTIGKIVEAALRHADEVLVVDDGSQDRTVEISKKAGARVISHKNNMGYIEALRAGFRNATGNIIVTIDADGQHDPSDILRLTKPILEGKADVVIGARETMTLSEEVISGLTRLKVKVSDASSGFRALRRDLALEMKLKGRCTCGTFPLEAANLGARIGEIRIKTAKRDSGGGRIRKEHLYQALVVIRELLDHSLLGHLRSCEHKAST